MMPYPTISDDSNASLKDTINVISRERSKDLAEWNNLPERFVLGRKVAKVPSASTDVVPTDRAGDFNVTVSFAYFCINDSGTIKWVRAGVATW